MHVSIPLRNEKPVSKSAEMHFDSAELVFFSSLHFSLSRSAEGDTECTEGRSNVEDVSRSLSSRKLGEIVHS